MLCILLSFRRTLPSLTYLNRVVLCCLFFFHDISGSLWDLAEFYWVLVDFTGVLLGYTGFNWVLPSFTRFYLVLLGFVGFY